MKQGKLKVLAVASRRRSSLAPDVPTLAEAGFEGVYADSLFGVYAPATVPVDAVARLTREINALLSEEAVKARFVELGAEAVPMAAGQFAHLVRDEAALFGRIVRERGIRPD